MRIKGDGERWGAGGYHLASSTTTTKVEIGVKERKGHNAMQKHPQYVVEPCYQFSTIKQSDVRTNTGTYRCTDT